MQQNNLMYSGMQIEHKIRIIEVEMSFIRLYVNDNIENASAISSLFAEVSHRKPFLISMENVGTVKIFQFCSTKLDFLMAFDCWSQVFGI